MNTQLTSALNSILKLLPSLALGLITCNVLAQDNDRDDHARHQAYDNQVLVSSGAETADFVDANLINGWGVAFNPTGFVWVADNHSGKSTLYDGTGKPQSLVVTIPGVAGSVGSPTGIVFSGGADFVVTGTSASGAPVSGPARFIFSTEAGTIAAWAPAVNPTNAIIMVNNSNAGAIYKGLAFGGNGTTHLLYASDFHNNRIDVFDASFKPVALAANAFVDPRLPHGFAPFGIQAINGDIYVTYAKQDANAEDEIAGPGLGFVAVYDPNGQFIARVASRDGLNAPWGLALAPASFGEFGGALLVGNFGDGVINAYEPTSGRFMGALRDKDHHRIRIDGLWGIAFGNGIAAQKTNSLFYAAGPDDENNGTYGVVTAVTSKY